MTEKFLIQQYWERFSQGKYFQAAALMAPDAVIRWPNTGEAFSREQFVAVNQNYPGSWRITLEKLRQTCETVITIAKIESLDSSQSFYAVSFFAVKEGLISEITEYWGENTPSPSWRSV